MTYRGRNENPSPIKLISINFCVIIPIIIIIKTLRLPMSKEKTIEKVLSGQSDNNINFSDLRKLMISLDFKERIRGDHFIYTKEDVYEIINRNLIRLSR